MKRLIAREGFTLVEVLTVMGVMMVLLVMSASVMSGKSRSGGERKAARSLVLGVLNHARAKALTSGKPVAVAMVPYESARKEMMGKGLSIFDVRQDEVSNRWEVKRQTRRWVFLPRRMIFSAGATVSKRGQNAFAEEGVLNIQVRGGDGRRGEVAMPAIIFGSAGHVIWPKGSGELELHVGEGVIQEGRVVATSEDFSDWQAREVFVIGRQTGRARYLRTR